MNLISATILFFAMCSLYGLVASTAIFAKDEDVNLQGYMEELETNEKSPDSKIRERRAPLPQFYGGGYYGPYHHHHHHHHGGYYGGRGGGYGGGGYGRGGYGGGGYGRGGYDRGGYGRGGPPPYYGGSRSNSNADAAATVQITSGII